ncbi:hypothetical protein PI126_g14810 [Phytophthora idaei]|nr:hypothetical protein PI126_g14810 [Phytophthora idaei]
MDGAAKYATVAVLDWLRANGYKSKCSTGVMDHAATFGRLEVLKWLHSNDAGESVDHTRYPDIIRTVGYLQTTVNDKTPEKPRAIFGITEEFTEEEQLMQTLVADEQEGDDMQEMR